MITGDASARLELAICNSAEAAGCPVAIVEDKFTRWASATFVGGRYLMKLEAVHTETLGRWLEGLSAAELKVPGHLVADVNVIASLRAGQRYEIYLEALTVIESKAAASEVINVQE